MVSLMQVALNHMGHTGYREKWMIGLTNPKIKKVFAWLPAVESAVATSGNYEKYVIINDEKYSHIIDQERATQPRE